MSLCPETSTKTAVQEFHLCFLFLFHFPSACSTFSGLHFYELFNRLLVFLLLPLLFLHLHFLIIFLFFRPHLFVFHLFLLLSHESLNLRRSHCKRYYHDFFVAKSRKSCFERKGRWAIWDRTGSILSLVLLGKGAERGDVTRIEGE